MVEPIEGLPHGVLGFRLTGKLERDEYHDALMAPIYAALERGDKLRLLVELPDEFEGLDAGALWEDLKAAGSVGLKHRSSWERFAVVTDKDWVRHGVAVFGWVSPGELKVFADGERSQATTWLSE
jgi:stage II sporulation SpoAA-like protein